MGGGGEGGQMEKYRSRKVTGNPIEIENVAVLGRFFGARACKDWAQNLGNVRPLSQGMGNLGKTGWI